ncbi:MAG: metallophosphoesterase [Thaumarchaeota archaeon]|nr:metallophosphoesterase [Candidatus Calditenuaceae archaeon]MCX8202798.1 metallophosphoesterase [Nitrososphaeria archaeon]MDW8043549.1 metallophosphoesterase [Nitrososphaerota archaeon]
MLRFAGERPAVLIESSGRRYLLVTDVHLGYELELAAKGVRVPPQAPKVTRQLLELGEESGAEVLVLLGDIKHRVTGVSWSEEVGVRTMLSELSRRFEEVVVLPGNHDAGISELAKDTARLAGSRGIRIGGYWVMHGHTWPLPESLDVDAYVIGHTHPTAVIRTPEGDLRMRVNLVLKGSRSRLARAIAERPGYAEVLEVMRPRGTVKLLVLAHFSPMAPGVDVAELPGSRRTSPLLRSGAFDVAEAEVLSTSGELLGRLTELGVEEEA